MKLLILAVFLLLSITCACGSSSILPKLPNSTAMVHQPSAVDMPKNFYQIAARRLHDLWAKWSGNNQEDTFIGRCLGAARKLKMIMPLIVFKLGVILTVLVFLTIFSLKSLGLLFALLLLNASGAVAKLALLFKGGGESPPKAQNVHFHIHQSKDGLYHEPHNVATWSGYERSDFDSNQVYYDEPNNEDNLFNYKLYNNLYNKY